MFKRIRWLGLGAAVGAASSVWAQRKARTLASRYTPAGLAGAAVDRARSAVAEGRATMHQREAELRAGLAAPSAAGEPAARNAPLNGNTAK
jgi:hypothetical protein